jgi:hypothetical protein
MTEFNQMVIHYYSPFSAKGVQRRSRKIITSLSLENIKEALTIQRGEELEEDIIKYKV